VAEKKEINKIKINNINLMEFKLIISKISPNKLYVKGPPKFAIHNKNQNLDITGNKFSLALLSMILREWERSYIIFAQENIPEEHSPWANIIIIVPFILQKFFDSRLVIIKAMWTTDE